jgi:UDP-glucose:glycoprotein glucosyltransferase
LNVIHHQKEPKLVRAKHIPEWEKYDSEIAQFAHRLSQQGIIHSGLVDADASVLADAGSQMTQAQPPESVEERVATPPDYYHPKDEL